MRNEICKALRLTPLGTINYGGAYTESFGVGGLGNMLMDGILDYLYDWHLEPQTFVSREEGEFGNEAATRMPHMD